MPKAFSFFEVFRFLRSILARFAILGLAVGGTAALIYAFSDSDLRRMLFKSSIPTHILALENSWTPDIQKIAAAKSLAWFSSSYSYCASLVEQGAINAAVSFLDYWDSEKHAQIPEFIAKMFFHVASFDGLRDSLIDEKALEALRKLSSLQVEEVRRWTSQCIVLLLTKTRDPYLVLKGAGIASLLSIDDQRLAVDAMAVIHSLSLQDRSLLLCEKSEGDLSRTLLNLRKLGSSPDLAIATLANVLLEEGAKVGGAMDFLQEIVVEKNEATIRQIVRLLANLSADDRFKDDLVDEWLPYLSKQFVESDLDEKAKLAAIVAVANVAEREKGARSAIVRSILKGALKAGPSRYPAEHRRQIARLAANLSFYESSADLLWSASRGERLLEWARDSDALTRRSTVQAFSQFVKTGRGARDFASSSTMMDALLQWGQDEDLHVVRSAVQLIANISIHESVAMRAQERVQALLRACAVSSDELVRHEAIRAQASLADLRLKSAKYAEGINLLHPPPSSADSDALFDIVFIHGVTGDPISTWRAGPEHKDPKIEGSWARDWVPVDFPRSRVISIGYEWGGRSIPLKTQSLILLQKLRLAALGRRPIVFICHSFGGLLVKEMLRYASTHDEYGNILSNTKGIVFFSTPHLGSELTHYRQGYTDVIFRGNPVTDDLTPSPELEKLNQEFIALIPNVRTLSVGEGPTCFGLGTRYDCIQIVSDNSSNPGYNMIDDNLHKYIKTFYDHREVCKPADRRDSRYTLVHDFIRDVTQTLKKADLNARPEKKSEL